MAANDSIQLLHNAKLDAKRGEISFTPRYTLPEEGFIHFEWGCCACCGAKAICLKMYVVGEYLSLPEVCHECIDGLYDQAVADYRRNS